MYGDCNICVSRLKTVDCVYFNMFSLGFFLSIWKLSLTTSDKGTGTYVSGNMGVFLDLFYENHFVTNGKVKRGRGSKLCFSDSNFYSKKILGLHLLNKNFRHKQTHTFEKWTRPILKCLHF